MITSGNVISRPDPTRLTHDPNGYDPTHLPPLPKIHPPKHTPKKAASHFIEKARSAVSHIKQSLVDQNPNPTPHPQYINNPNLLKRKTERRQTSAVVMQKKRQTTTPRGRGGRAKKLKPTGGAGSPAAAAAAEGLQLALTNDPLETPLRIINQADSEGAADSEYRGTGSHFKNPVKHIPPISVNWPIEDEAGRISASDAYRILFSYVTPWPHFIHFKKDYEGFNFVAMRVPDHFGRHVPNGKHQLKFHNKGKIWSITSTSNQQKKAHYLTSGWQEFIDENEIRSGDICICELVGECEVKVLMLKVRDPSHTYINKVVSYLKDGGSTSDL